MRWLPQRALPVVLRHRTTLVSNRALKSVCRSPTLVHQQHPHSHPSLHCQQAQVQQLHVMSAPTLSKSSSSSSAASAATLEQLLARPAIYDRFASLPPVVDAAGHPVPTVSLFDFNLLARVYTDGAKRFRAHAAPELLRWNWRRARIHELLRQAQSDVICLQEVVQAEFDNVEVRAQKKAAEEARQAAAAEQAAKAAEKKAEMARKAEKRAANKAKVAGAAVVSGDAAAAPAAASAPEAVAAAPASASASDEQTGSAPAAAVAAAESSAAAGASSNDATAPAAADAASSSAAAAAPLMEDDGDDEVSTEAADPAYVPPAEGDFSTFFTEQGYTWRLQEPAQKADKYPVGVCVAWKISTFYPEPVVFDSRSRAVIVALKFRAPGTSDSDPEPPATLSNTLFVCNVHLQGHYTETSTRLNQVKSLFKQLERHVAELAAGRLGAPAKSKQDQQERKKKKDKAAKQDAAGAAAPAEAEAAAASPSPSPSPAPAAAAGASAPLVPMLLLTGDFNQNERFSSVHRLCVDGRVEAGYVDGGTKQVVTPSEVTQPWPLQSAYDKTARPEAYPVFSFHNNHYGPLSHYQDVLDFIYSPPSSLPLLGSLAVLSQGQRGEEERRLIDQTSLPNELIPSDHMPVGATFWPKLWHEELQRQEQSQQAAATVEPSA